MSRGRNRPTGPDQTHDRGPGQPARHPAGLTALTTAGESLHAPVCAGVEEARPRAKPRHSPRHLCRRSCNPVPTGQRGEGAGPSARDHGQAEADSERREDTDLQGSGRRVRLLGIYVRADVLSYNGPGPVGLLAVKEEHQAHGRKGPRVDRPSGELARDHRARRRVEPRALRVGQLLQCRYHPQSLSRARQLHGCIEYARFADDLVILINAYKRHGWLVGAVDKRLREEFGKLQVEINDEKSRIVDLERGESFGFLGFDFRYLRSLRGVWRPHYTPKLKKADGTDARAQRGVPPIPDATDRTGDKPDQSGATRMGELLRGWALQRVLQLHQGLGGEEGQAPAGACSEAKGLRLGTME